jgi:hypothetical protein
MGMSEIDLDKPTRKSVKVEQEHRDAAALLMMDLGGYDERLDKKLRNGLWDDHAAIQALAEQRPVRIVKSKRPDDLMAIVKLHFVFLCWLSACIICLLTGHTDAALVFGFLAMFTIST